MSDLIPNNGEQFNPVAIPDDRKQAEEEELGQIAKDLPVIQELITWFDELIASTDSVKNVNVTLCDYKDRGITANEALVVHDILRDMLTSKKAEFKNKVTTYKDRLK